MEVHEAHEKIHEAGHQQGFKGVAILITVLAALLALCEMSGKGAQHTSLAANIEASNLWAFFQAKTIRQTVLRAADQAFETLGPDIAPPGRAENYAKRIELWRQTVERYETEPSTQEGRTELAARAKIAEAKRDKALAAYHLFEYGSAAFQIAIVLASASVITAMIALAWVAGGLGVLGVAAMLVGWLAPTLVHL
jgi:Domain of unknown function (DUF4337)